MFFRGILNFIIRCQIALYQGWIEYCQKGCLIGSHYLVKPNYHSCERLLWRGIYIGCLSFGCILLFLYITNFSDNVFRIVIEDHGRDDEFNYPALGICEMGIKNDNETLARVEEVLNGSIYQRFPQLRLDGRLKRFVHVMTFQNLNYRQTDIRKFLNYTNTLKPELRDFLQNYNYTELAEKISGKCEDFFDECLWLDEENFECCNEFRFVPTMFGKCFIFNSELNRSANASVLVNKIKIFEEPFRLHVTLKKAARIFLMNHRDVPETLLPFSRYIITKKGVTLSMEFNIVPTVVDEGLRYLKPINGKCIMDQTKKDEIYLHYSHSTCLTNAFYNNQMQQCNCTNLYAPVIKAKMCNLTQYACLEEMDFINSNFKILTLSEPCYPNCFDSEYVMENIYYGKSEEKYKDVLTLDIVLLNFPTIHRRRQAIRQTEDTMVSLSGIVGLFMGLSFISILEYIYLTCNAFFKTKKTNLLQVATTIPSIQNTVEPQAAGGRAKGLRRKIALQP